MEALPSILAYIQVIGPDPKQLKAARQAFASTSDGRSSLSASGIVWAFEPGKAYILAPASLLLSYIRPERRHDLGSCQHNDLLPLSR